MTESEWMAQVDLLRSTPDQAPTSSMRARWRRHIRSDELQRPIELMAGVGEDSRIRLLLFSLEPGPTDAPAAVVTMPDDDRVGSIPQGSIVEVRGWPKPGGAIAVTCRGELVRALGPCDYSNARRDRWGAQATAASSPATELGPVARWRRTPRWLRALMILTVVAGAAAQAALLLDPTSGETSDGTPVKRDAEGAALVLAGLTGGLIVLTGVAIVCRWLWIRWSEGRVS